MNNFKKTTEKYIFAKKIVEYARNCITTLDREQLLQLLTKIDMNIDRAYKECKSEHSSPE